MGTGKLLKAYKQPVIVPSNTIKYDYMLQSKKISIAHHYKNLYQNV